mgnify:CR=1 FL=1
MSEYQYYEFQAVDRPLGEVERRELRNLSTRARITATSFVNHYEWGDFKGDPARLMERYFDLFLYLANWGARCFSMRLPKQLVDAGDLERFLVDDDVAAIRVAGDNLIADFFIDEAEFEEWDDGSGWLAALAPLRSDVLNGDLRVFYLVWLMAVEIGHVRDSAVEPLPGIAPLSASLGAFADFFGIDRDLVNAAADDGAAARPADPPPVAVESFVRSSLPEDEKVVLLLSLHEGDDPHLGAKFRRRCRQAIGFPTPAGSSLRTVAELRASARRLAEERRRIASEKATDERRRREEERAKARARRLAALAEREEDVWREVEDSISLRNAAGYGKATALLTDLREIAQGNGEKEEFARRLDAIRSRHGKKGRFLERLADAGLG